MMLPNICWSLVLAPFFFLGEISLRFAVGASFLDQLKGWPSSFALAEFRNEFLRESSYLLTHLHNIYAHRVPAQARPAGVCE